MVKKESGKAVDLVVYRTYVYKRVNVIVKIDFLEKKLSLVEKDENSESGFKPKDWFFADRTTEYLNGWRLILQAIDYAIVEAKKELVEAKARDDEKFLEVFVELNKIKDSEVN